MNDNRLAKYVLLYAGAISLAILVFAYNSQEKAAEKAIDVFNNISIAALSGIFGYLTAKNDIEDYNKLLKENQRLLDELDNLE